MDIPPKFEQDFLQCLAAYEKELQKNEQLYASNDILRHNLDRAQQAINTLESQIHADDENGCNSCSSSSCRASHELGETLRLVELLETNVFQLEEDKLRMEIEHQQEMEEVIQTYKGPSSGPGDFPIQGKTEIIDPETRCNV